MKKESIYEDLALVGRRATGVFLLVKIIFIFLIFYFWKIQILDYRKFWRQSEANRIREVVLPAQRGLITDRNGVVLVKNIASFKVSIIRENCTDMRDSMRKISKLLDLDETVIEERIARYISLPKFKPIVIKDELTSEEVARIEVHKLEFPELVIESEPRRFYPFRNHASHVIGYLQEISESELRQDRFRYRALGDMIGKTGIERQFERKLAGTEGLVLEIADSLGRKRDELTRREPIAGETLRLALDYDLQSKTEALLEGREGAVVIMNPKNGEVLAMASYPNFDPNKFITRFTPQEWMDLMNSPEFPLENRVIRGVYSPGSIFKPAMALSALDLNIVNEYTTYFCSGSAIIYGHPFGCWYREGHGAVTLTSGLKHSCNIYFYQIGKMMGIDKIALYARHFGFGSPTGIDLPSEKEGLVPDPDWKRRVRHAPWYPGETISISIGQGPLLVTPLQAAVFTSRIANRGGKITPHMLLTEESAISPKEINVSDDPIEISKDIYEKVIRGMWESVNRSGTSWAAQVPGFDVCGKTGSTQVVSRETAEKLALQKREIKTHSWFTGFAPMKDPEVVITVLVEYGGGGGATATPLAHDLFELYRSKYDDAR